MATRPSKTKKSKRGSASTVTPSYADGKARNVWLTFDDGPDPANTSKVLATLAKFSIKATFFVLGQNVKRHTSTVQVAFDAGHRIGNHSYSHPNLTTMSAARIRDEISKTDALIRSFPGPDKIFRPPYGAHNKLTDQIIAELGYRSIFWNIDTEDWKSANKPDGWITVGIMQMKGRTDCRVLNHDIHATTANNLEAFIQRIKRFGNVTFMNPSTL